LEATDSWSAARCGSEGPAMRVGARACSSR
jgi:hypothetical protein